jgi:hypothetical protein
MQRYNLSVMLFLSGLFISTGLFTMVIESYCIWGFYNTKEQQYYAPINSTKQGNKVDVNDTTPYTAMPLNLNPLMQCLMSPS